MNRRELVRALGAALALPALSGREADRLIAAGCRAHRGAGQVPGVLDPHQRDTVATIAELIIPTTDTPGARAAQVHDFIDLLLAEWAPDEHRTAFLTGLADVDARAHAAYGTDFLTATEPQRTELLKKLEADQPMSHEPTQDTPPPFFHMMKFLTVFGFCTSEVGATTVLRYEAIPGSYDPCVGLERWRAAPGDY
jgi:Gluconate 2-dehydrogenase subunit 3